MPMTVAELFVSLGIKGNKDVVQSLSNVQGGLQKTAEMSWAAKAGIFAAVVGLEEISRSAVGAAMDLQTFQGASGLSIESIQRMDYWARRNNVSVNELHGSVHNLQIMQAKMMAGDQGATRALTFFGVDPYQNADTMLQNLFKKIRAVGNNPAQIGFSRMFAEQLGIGVNMYAAARTGDASMKGYSKQMALTGGEMRKLLALNRQWEDFWMMVRGTSQKTVANDLAGPITGFVKILRDDVEEVSHLISKFMTTYKKLDSPGFQTALKAIGAALLVALAPIAPYTAALIALGAVLEDFHKFEKGEDSYIGWSLGSKDDTKMLQKERDEYNKKHGRLYRTFFGGSSAEDILKIREYEASRNATAAGTTRAGAAPVNVTNNNHFDIKEAKDAHHTARVINGHLQKAAAQNAALIQNK